jgi:hypothetical protein
MNNIKIKLTHTSMLTSVGSMMDSFRVNVNTYLGPRDELRVAYKRGYDHGVWMHCETLEEEKENENK